VSSLNGSGIIPTMLMLLLPAIAMIVAVWLVRAVRQKLTSEGTLPEASLGSTPGVPIEMYHTVIQELKQQKHELSVLTQTEQRRARVVESLNQAVFANLLSGVVVFDMHGVVKIANPAARELLGYASISALSAEEVFRGAEVDSDAAASGSNDHALIAEMIRITLQDKAPRRMETEYRTPGGQVRHFGITLSQICGSDGSPLGASCLIDDLSAFEDIRRQQQLHGQISAELALDLRTSLATIAGYAQQLASNRDPDLSQQIAEDISMEAARLDRHIGGFLTGHGPLATNSAFAGGKP